MIDPQTIKSPILCSKRYTKRVCNEKDLIGNDGGDIYNIISKIRNLHCYIHTVRVHRNDCNQRKS